MELNSLQAFLNNIDDSRVHDGVESSASNLRITLPVPWFFTWWPSTPCFVKMHFIRSTSRSLCIRSEISRSSETRFVSEIVSWAIKPRTRGIFVRDYRRITGANWISRWVVRNNRDSVRITPTSDSGFIHDTRRRRFARERILGSIWLGDINFNASTTSPNDFSTLFLEIVRFNPAG